MDIDSATRSAAADILLQRLIAHVERQHQGTIDALAGPANRVGSDSAEDRQFVDAVDGHISRILRGAAGKAY